MVQNRVQMDDRRVFLAVLSFSAHKKILEVKKSRKNKDVYIKYTYTDILVMKRYHLWMDIIRRDVVRYNSFQGLRILQTV